MPFCFCFFDNLPEIPIIDPSGPPAPPALALIMGFISGFMSCTKKRVSNQKDSLLVLSLRPLPLVKKIYLSGTFFVRFLLPLVKTHKKIANV
jgi:hypothetical protein